MARMPKVPSYSLHKPSGKAVVKIRQESIYLGEYGSDESRESYARIVADLLSGREIQPPATKKKGSPSLVSALRVADLVAQYQKYADCYYRKGGKPTSEVASIRCALRYLTEVYSDLPANVFAVGDLRATRQRMVDAGLSRGVVNQNIGRIARMFRWAASVEKVDSSVWLGLQTLPGLKAGRTEARETKPIEPVDDAIVNDTLPQLSPTIRAMVELQRATGMRPNEVCKVRPCDVDRSGDIWKYTPAEHKTQHHGKQRVVLIGPRGQSILKPFLLRPHSEYCFRPGRGTLDPRADRCYRVSSYRQAIQRACNRAFPAPSSLEGEELKAWRKARRWAPNRLRHSFATQARATHGLEAAQVLLGHSSANITQVYAERDLQKGLEAASRIG